MGEEIMVKEADPKIIRYVVFIIVLSAVVIALSGGRAARVIAITTIVVFVGGWLSARYVAEETFASVGVLAGIAAAILAFFAYAATPPSTLPSEPVNFVPNGTGRIAFVSDRGKIHIMNADGAGETRLTNDEASFPAWSSDGERIAFVSHNEIYVMQADGANQTRLTNSWAASNSHPDWSPDGQRLACLSDRDGAWEVYVMNADGANQIRLTHNYQNSWCTPAWSPDGQRLAFVADEIYVMNVDGADQIHLPRPETKLRWAWRAAWSPDGEQIAFLSSKGGIDVMNADGTNRTRLTDRGSGPDACDNIAWSPDGQRLAFVANEVYVMNVDGTNQTNLTNYQDKDWLDFVYFYTLSWSPDGQRIAYTVSGGGRNNSWLNGGFYVMNADGANTIHISGRWPTWAP